MKHLKYIVLSSLLAFFSLSVVAQQEEVMLINEVAEEDVEEIEAIPIDEIEAEVSLEENNPIFEKEKITQNGLTFPALSFLADCFNEIELELYTQMI